MLGRALVNTRGRLGRIGRGQATYWDAVAIAVGRELNEPAFLSTTPGVLCSLWARRFPSEGSPSSEPSKPSTSVCLGAPNWHPLPPFHPSSSVVLGWRLDPEFGSLRAIHSLRQLSAQPLREEEESDQSTSSKSGQDASSADPAQGGAKGPGQNPGPHQPSAAEVDRAMDDYDRLLDKSYRSLYPAAEISLGRRVSNAIWQPIVWCWRFIVRLPRNTWLVLTSPMAEKKQWFASTWKHTKEGAQHYWVRAHLSCVRVVYSMRVPILPTPATPCSDTPGGQRAPRSSGLSGKVVNLLLNPETGRH